MFDSSNFLNVMIGNEFQRGNPIRKLSNDLRECIKKKHSKVGGS
jgi:hypothetical protein